MKLGIVGVGNIVQHAMLPTLAEVSIAYTSILMRKEKEQEGVELVKRFQLDALHFDYEDMLASEIDTVYIALPNHLHFTYAKQAMLHHKHVIVEKPACVNLKEWQELEVLAKEQHLILLEAMSLYYLPAFQALTEKIQELGDIKLVNFNYSQYSSRYDAFQQGIILPAFDVHKAGGALMDINIYNISGLVGLFKKPSKVHYFANIERGIDTSGVLIMEYPGFQAMAVGAKDCAYRASAIQGNKGTITFQSINGISAFTITRHQQKEEDFTYRENSNHFIYEFREFDRMVAELDYETANRMNERTHIVLEIIDEAKRQAGLVFDHDAL